VASFCKTKFILKKGKVSGKKLEILK